jgi:hypothetical protein
MAVPNVANKSGRSTERTTASGRRQALIYIDPSLLKDIKKLAIDLEVSASVLIEAAIREFMERQNKKNINR